MYLKKRKEKISIIMKTVQLTLFFLILIKLQSFAQNGVIEFTHTTHDFGSVKEEDGPITHEFKFLNKGTTPVVISNVQASCGCTTPAWSKDPVMPGATGFIQAQYDPRNRPGIINKSLTVTANTEPSNTILFIKGNVIPKPKTIADEFPDTIGNLRIKSRYMDMGDLTTKDIVVKEFQIYNDASGTLTLSNPKSLPKHIKLNITPTVLQPKEKGTIKVTYDPKGKNDFGWVNDIILIPSNDKKHPLKDLNIVASIKEYFPPMTATELAEAPQISIDRMLHNFDTLTAGKVVSTEFLITNNGQQELVLKKVKASCNCTTGLPEKSTLKPGESTKLKVTFNSTGRSGADMKMVTVYCNDPKNPEPVITIKSFIEKK